MSTGRPPFSSPMWSPSIAKSTFLTVRSESSVEYFTRSSSSWSPKGKASVSNPGFEKGRIRPAAPRRDRDLPEIRQRDDLGTAHYPRGTVDHPLAGLRYHQDEPLHDRSRLAAIEERPQALCRGELNAQRNPWIVRDLVTWGSRLAHAEALMALIWPT